jgi:hypothetical protein
LGEPFGVLPFSGAYIIIFLDAVNRVMRLNGIIRGDTDTVTTFNDTAHNATLNLAIVAIQDELGDLVADRLIPYELASGTITLVSGTRTYALASDFIRFYGNAFFLNGTREVYEYMGGRVALQSEVPQYKTAAGTPNWWYWEPATTKQIGFYQVPNSSGDLYVYDYEKSVMVTASTDTIPLHNTEESNQFCLMCSRRFKVLYEDTEKQSDVVAVLDMDNTYRRARRSLFQLIKGENPPNKYSPTYR